VSNVASKPAPTATPLCGCRPPLTSYFAPRLRKIRTFFVRRPAGADIQPPVAIEIGQLQILHRDFRTADFKRLPRRPRRVTRRIQPDPRRPRGFIARQPATICGEPVPSKSPTASACPSFNVSSSARRAHNPPAAAGSV